MTNGMNIAAQQGLTELQRLVFQPWTNLQGWFSPQLSVRFGSNTEDQQVEQRVLDQVGSYGKQLNRLFDVVAVLTGRIDRTSGPLTKAEEDAIERFLSIARAADRVSADFQGKPRRYAGEDEVTAWIARLDELKRVDSGLYRHYAEKLRASLTPARKIPGDETAAAG